jgi:hypothetical protein
MALEDKALADLAARIARLEATLQRFVTAWSEIAAGVSLGVQQAGTMIGRIADAVMPPSNRTPGRVGEEAC